MEPPFGGYLRRDPSHDWVGEVAERESAKLNSNRVYRNIFFLIFTKGSPTSATYTIKPSSTKRSPIWTDRLDPEIGWV